MKCLLKLAVFTLVLCFFAIPSQEVFAADELVAHWRLDEGSGTTALDASGNGHHGTLVNVSYSDTVPPVEFDNPHSAYFNPATGGRIISTNLSLNEYTQFTLSGWAYPTGNSDRSGWFGQNDVFEFGFNQGNMLTCYTTRGEVNYEYDPETFLNHWHHISCLATETELIVYIDGVNVGSDELDEAETFGSSGDTFSIGAGVMDGGTQHPFSGYIDDVRVYTRGLSPVEMESLGTGSEDPIIQQEPEGEEGEGEGDEAEENESQEQQGLAQQVNNTNSASLSAAYRQACGNLALYGAPDLFQIDVSDTQAVLYYSPILGPVTDHMISYGFSSGDDRFGVEYPQKSSTGVLSYTVTELDPETTYYFKVRAGNGCMPGDWSNEVKVTTTKQESGAISYFRSYLHKILSLLPSGY